jgi:putative FmdB family regulatory protein
MPIYEYVCKSCGSRTEVIQRMGEKPPVACPHCGKRALKKAVSAPAVHFKGSGWYVTDYSRAKKESKSDKSSSEKSEGGSSDEKAGKSEKVEKVEKSEKAEKKKDKKD